MLKKVKAAIEHFGMPIKNSDILVAISGGADSVALLFSLLDLQAEYNYSLRAIHINHNLRGEESMRDQNFVYNLCNRLNVPLVIESVNVMQRVESSNEGVELAARNIRYNLFSKHNVDVVATAHTADDNAETVLFNLLRGTGIKGLCGIPPVRDCFVRPLIFCTRNDVLSYLKSIGETYVTDSSNNSDDYTRNKIRHSLIPVFKELNPSFSDTVIRTSGILRDDFEYLNKVATEKFNLYFNNNYLSEEISNFSTSIRMRVLAMYCEANGILYNSHHLQKMDEVLKGEIVKTQLPGNYFFHRVSEGFLIEKINKLQNFFNECFNFDEKELTSGIFSKITYKEFIKINKVNNLLFKFAIDCDKIDGDVTFRSRNNGDKYRPVSRNVTKSIKKLLSDSKLPFGSKDKLFVLEDKSGIIFTNLFGIDERVKVTEKSKNILIYKGDNAFDY